METIILVNVHTTCTKRETKLILLLLRDIRPSYLIIQHNCLQFSLSNDNTIQSSPGLFLSASSLALSSNRNLPVVFFLEEHSLVLFSAPIILYGTHMMPTRVVSQWCLLQYFGFCFNPFSSLFFLILCSPTFTYLHGPFGTLFFHEINNSTVN